MKTYIYLAEATGNMVDQGTYCYCLNVVYSLCSVFFTILIYYEIVHLMPGILSMSITALVIFLLYCISVKEIKKTVGTVTDLFS